MLGKKTAFWIVLFSTLSLRAVELEGLSSVRIQQQEEKILNFQRKIKRLEKAGYTVAAAGFTLGALLLYKHYQAPQKKENTDKKDASKELTVEKKVDNGWWAYLFGGSEQKSSENKSDLERREEIAQKEWERVKRESENLELKQKLREEEKLSLWEIIKEKYAWYAGVGFLVGMGNVAYKLVEKVGTISFRRFLQFFKNRIDDASFFGRQVLSNCDNLDLFLQNYVDPECTEIDRARHRSQIVEGHKILIRCIENLIAAFSIKARQSDNMTQAKWLVSNDNRIFKGVLRLNRALEAKLVEDADNPEFCNISLIREALERLLKSVDVVAQNCEAQYREATT